MGAPVATRRNALSYYFTAGTPASPSPTHVSLHSLNPGDDGATELPFTQGYFRNTRFGWSVVSATRGEDTSSGSFGENEGATSRTVRGFGVWDANSGGNYLFGGEVTGSPVAWLPGEVIDWAAGGVGLAVSGSRAASDLTRNIIRWWLDLSPARPANTYLSLHYGDPGTTGSNEYNGGGYSRTGAISWQTVGGLPEVSNANTLNTGAADPDWGGPGPITHFGIWDSSAGGSYIIGGSVQPTQPKPNPSANIQVLDDQLTVRLL